MAEDRLGDLGPERRSAAERFAELDELADEEGGPPEPRDPRSYTQKYTWVVGVAALIVIIIVSINSGANPGRGYLGPDKGTLLPAFAAPSAASGVAGDANVRAATGGTDVQGPEPACDVHGPDVVNICELWPKPLVITFITKGCQQAFDVVEEVKASHPGVNFVGVLSGIGDPAEAKRLTEAGEWSFPIASDPDAAVFNVYRAGDCPTTVLATAGGQVKSSVLGPQTTESLSAEADGIEAPDDH